MTKTDYRKLIIGSRVRVETNDVDHTEPEPKIVPITLTGTVIRFSAGMGNQVLIRFDETWNESWYGRTGIERL